MCTSLAWRLLFTHSQQLAGLATPVLVGVQGSKDDPVSDQWLEPYVIVGEDGKPVGAIEDGDSVLIFNFRAGAAPDFSPDISE